MKYGEIRSNATGLRASCVWCGVCVREDTCGVVCVSTCMKMLGGGCLCTCVCMHVNAEGQAWVSISISLSMNLDVAISWGRLGCLASLRDLVFQIGITGTHYYTWLFPPEYWKCSSVPPASVVSTIPTELSSWPGLLVPLQPNLVTTGKVLQFWEYRDFSILVIKYKTHNIWFIDLKWYTFRNF